MQAVIVAEVSSCLTRLFKTKDNFPYFHDFEIPPEICSRGKL